MVEDAPCPRAPRERDKPAAGRFKVAVLAVGAEALFQLLLIFPIAAVLLFGAVWFNRVFLLWAASLAVLGLWWLLQPSFALPGRAIGEGEAPRLHAMVEQLRARMRALPIHEIRIDGSCNAGALELGHGWIPGRVRRILILGGPLVAGASSAALQAVIAHELGHFSRQHGRLGHWVYRARLGWLHAADAAGDASVLDQAARAFARWFIPRFEPIAFAHSRQCEYEADAVAARATGSMSVPAGLAELGWLAACENGVREALVRAHAQPPGDIWQRMAQDCARAAPLREWFDALWAERSASDDTHPCLRERAQALGGDADGVWRNLLAQRGRGDAALVEETLRAAGAQLDPAQAYAWELGHRRMQHEDALAGWLGSLPGYAQFKDACARAASGDPSSVDLFEALIAMDPVWAAPARGELARWGARFLSDGERQRNARLLAQALLLRGRAASQAMDSLRGGSFEAVPAPSLPLAVLRACLADQQVVTAAHCAFGSAVLSVKGSPRRYALVIAALRVDLEAARQRTLFEDDIREAFERQMQEVIPPPSIALAITYFAAEPAPGWTDAFATTLL
jgi:Zn-dependent protease with chaperone function